MSHNTMLAAELLCFVDNQVDATMLLSVQKAPLLLSLFNPLLERFQLFLRLNSEQHILMVYERWRRRLFIHLRRLYGLIIVEIWSR